MTVQELLDALKKAQNETNLDQVAVWALIKYLQAAWKGTPGKNVRPFDLGQVMGDFFVDLSQHRLPEKITKQTPQTEAQLLDFFGAAEGSKSHFWKQCIEIWDVTLAQDPAYAKGVRNYFDLLLASSLQGERKSSAAASVKPAVVSVKKPPRLTGVAAGAPVVAPAPTAPAESEPVVENSEPAVAEAPLEAASAPAAEPPVEPVIPVPLKSPFEPVAPAAPLAADPIQEPGKLDVPAPAASPAGPETPVPAPASKIEPEPKTFPRNAYLVLQGTRVIPLNQPLIKIGRQLDNHIILEDPRVSRSHAQIKLVNERFVIFDMNSTGGTFVNGQRTSQSVLYPGDVVSLAGVVFIFSQEMPAKPGDMKIIELGSPYAADRPTAVIHREEIQAPKEIGPKGPPDLPRTGPLKSL